MAQKSPRYCLYRDFVDAFMKCHQEMTRCDSHHHAQTKWNELKTNEGLVKRKIAEYLEKWKKAGRPERAPSAKKSPGKKAGTPKKDFQNRTFSSDDDVQNDDPNIIKSITPTTSKSKASIDIIEIDNEISAKEKKSPSPIQSDAEKIKAPVQESVLNDLTEITQRIESLVQIKSMGLLTPENHRTLKKLIEQKEQRTNDLKRLQARQRASTRYRERQKQRVEKLCVSNPDIAAELSKVIRLPPPPPPTTTTTRMQMDADCPNFLQIISQVAYIGGTTDEKVSLTLENLTEAIQERGYEIRKSSLYYRLMPQRALSHDGKKHVVTVPVRLRKMQGIELPPKHEDSHFTAAILRHIKDLAGIFGNDCVFYLTQDTKAKVKIGRPSDKGPSPLIMRLDYETSSVDLQTNPITPHHQLTPCIYAASIIDEMGLMTNVGPTYVSIRSAKHDRLTHEIHAIDFDRLVQLKGFEKAACDHLGRVKPIVIMNIDTNGSENNTRYSKTLASAIEKFKKYNLDALMIVNQAPGQALFNVVERRLSPMAQDLAGLILPHDHFGTHLNDNGLTEHAELEQENFKLTGDVLAEVWSMNVLDEYSVVAEYIKPLPIIDEQRQMADSTLALNGIVDRVCANAETPVDQRVDQTRPAPIMSTMEIKTECDIDEFWCATHVLQTQYTIQIIRCNNPSCCTPWRSNYIQVFPHRFLPAPAPFHRSSRGVKLAEIESSSATTNPISPFYGNLFQRIQFHGIIINRTKNDLLPFDACCPSLQTKLSSRICSICKQYIPTSTRLRNHYKIHQQHVSEIDLNHKEENIVDDDDLIDPYDMSIMSLNSTQKGVYLFTDMIEWLKSDFEDDPIVDIKTKSTAATASAMNRKDKQMAATATTTIQEEESMRMVSNKQRTTVNQTFTQEEMTTTTEVQCFNDTQTENGSVLDALEHLAMIDDGTGSIDYALSQQIWDHIEDLIDAI